MLIINSGTGDLAVTTTGTVTGYAAGMQLYNDTATGGNITVNASGTVTGGVEWGIYANNTGTGITTINATDVVSNAYEAIRIDNDASTGAITVNAANLTGQLDGIHTTQYGTGDVNVTTTGTVTGKVEQGMDIYSFGSGATTINASGDIIGNQWGIYVDDSSTGKDITINATNVTANLLYDGIRAWHRGSGALTITTTGTVTGTTEDGIDAKNIGTAATDLIIDANGAIGGMNGIRARNDGIGSTTITVDGVVTGGAGGIEDGAGVTTAEQMIAGINTYDMDTTVGNNFTTITLNSGAVVSATSGVAIRNDEGDSLTTINSGAIVQGKILLNDGSDKLVINGADFSQITLGDGGDDSSTADGYIDTLSFQNIGTSGSPVTVAGLGSTNTQFINWEYFDFVNSYMVVPNIVTEKVTVCGGSTTITDGTVGAGGVLGCKVADTIILDGSTTVAGVVEGAGGDDTISILGSASVTGNIYGDAEGQDNSGSTPGNDIITLNTTGSVPSILAGAGNDTFNWISGTMTSFNGEDGSDIAIVTATNYNGTQTLDGGDDVSIADGFIDTITLSGYNPLTVSSTTLANWEKITLDGTTLTSSDNELTTSTDAGYGLFLTNGSLLNAGTTFNLTGNG